MTDSNYHVHFGHSKYVRVAYAGNGLLSSLVIIFFYIYFVVLFCYLGITPILRGDLGVPFWFKISYASFMDSNIFGALQMNLVFIIHHQTLKICAFFFVPSKVHDA